MSETQLPPHWKVVSLGEVATLQRGKDLPQDKRQQGSYPVVGSNGVVGYHAEYAMLGPGVLVGRSGSVGKISWIEADYWALNTSLWVKDFHGHEPRFVYYFLTYMDLGKYTAGVSIPTLNRNLLHPLAVAIPPLSEQVEIARALDIVQAAKETRQHELTLERERKAALTDHLFTHGTRGEARKQTEIGEIPQSWEVCSLGNISEVAYGLTVNQERRRSTNLALYLTVANITRGALRLDEVKQIGMLDGDAERYRLKKGDVLLIEGSGNPRLLGSAAVWNDERPFVLHQNHLIRARFDQSKAVPEWMMDYLNSDSGRTQLLGKSKTSSGLHNINSSVIASLKIPLPSRHEQEEAAYILRSCEEVIIGLEKELSLLDELFQAMLEELMTGRLSAIPLT